MSLHIHQLIMHEGSSVNIYFKDGLSAIDVLEIRKIFRFGGNFEFINCGAKNEFITLKHAKSDMFNKLHHHTDD